MEEKKKDFISYKDDDDSQKDVWVDILEETLNYISFRYNNEQLTIPWHRILKVKRKRGDSNDN